MNFNKEVPHKTSILIFIETLCWEYISILIFLNYPKYNSSNTQNHNIIDTSNHIMN